MSSLFAPPVYQGAGGWANPGSFQSDLYESNPDAAWQTLLDRLLGVQNAGNNREQFYQRQQQPWYNRYLSSLYAHGPTYRWQDFLNDYSTDIQNQWNTASDTERGVIPNGGIGRLRYVGFPG